MAEPNVAAVAEVSPADQMERDRAFLKLAHEAFTGSTSYFDVAIRKRIIDDLRQFQGEHPQGSKYLSDAYRGRHKFFRPKTRSSVRKNEAIAAEALFSTHDVISVKPVDEDDPIEVASAEVQKELLQYRLTKTIPWFLISMGAYQDAQVQGLVCSYQHWDPKKDQPFVKLRPLENIRFDPSAEWYDPVNTSPYFIEMIPMYVKDVLARMKPGANGEAARWRNVPATELLKATVGYTNVVQLQREPGRVDPRNGITGITAFSIVWVHRNIVEIEGEDYVYHTLGTIQLLDDPKPLVQTYFTGERPYVIGFAMVETHRPYPSGPVRLGRDTQGEINAVTNQRLDNVSFAMNKRWIVRRTAQVDLRSIQRNVPSSATMVGDIEKDVKVLDTPDVTSSAYEEQDRLNADFDELMGSFSASSVNTNRKLGETVGGMNILTTDASQISGYMLRTWVETWAEPVLRQLVKLEQHYETDDVVLALAGKRANLLQRFGIDSMTDQLLMKNLTLTVNVGLGAVNPHDQLQNFLDGLAALKNILEDGILEKYGANIGEIIKEIFGKMGYKDGKRFFPGNMDPALQAAQSTIDQLQQLLKSKQQSPELIAAQVKKLLAEVKKIDADRVKIGVEAAFSAIQTGEVIAAVPGVAPVADIVMKQAGWVPSDPMGMDPNLPQGGPIASGLAIEDVKNKRTGISFTPGGGAGPQAGDTTPTTPMAPAAPATPGVGAAHGIETMRADSA